MNKLLKQELKKWEANEKKRNPEKPPEASVRTPDVSRVGIKPCDGNTHQQPKGKIRPDVPDRRLDVLGPVVGGVVSWKPIDRAAAMLLARAPWWAHPPQESSSKIPELTKPKTRKNQNMDIKSGGYAHPAQNPDQMVIVEKTRDQMNHEVNAAFVKETDKTLTKSGELVERAMDARAALDVMCDTFKASWFDFQKTSDERLKELRMTRMAIDTEMRQLMASLREVRTFFLEKDYEKEIARLKDFVETCERLQKLKESGFLDVVADTMLKLQVTNETAKAVGNEPGK